MAAQVSFFTDEIIAIKRILDEYPAMSYKREIIFLGYEPKF